MTTQVRIGVAAITCLLFGSLAVGDPKPSPHLALRATYNTGLSASGAEIISVRHTDGVAALTNVAGSVDVLDLSNPLQPVLLHRVCRSIPRPGRQTPSRSTLNTTTSWSCSAGRVS